MFDLVTKKKPGYVKGALIVEDFGRHPQGELIDKLSINKTGRANKSALPSTYLTDDNIGGMLMPSIDGDKFQSFSKGMGSNMSHEHIHAQIQSLNKIDPNAANAFYYKAYFDMPKDLRIHLRNYVKPIEVLPAVRDLLTDKEIRQNLLPRNLQDYTTLKHQAQTYWNNITDEVSKMTKEQIENIVDKYKKGNK
jgi:hypothetical protein